MLQNESIVRAAWPAVGPVDEVLVHSSVYLTEAAHSFRLQLKNHLSAGKKSKTPKLTQERPTHATIWVAKTYPPWQCTVLTTMRQMHQVTFLSNVYYHGKHCINIFKNDGKEIVNLKVHSSRISNDTSVKTYSLSYSCMY